MKMTEIIKCRVCGSGRLVKTVDLGAQELGGNFPKSTDIKLTSGPLVLLFCESCSAVQLGHSYALNEMYGENYGYRSGLNSTMVTHLSDKIHTLEKKCKLQEGDIVLDIGSNDGTSLNAYQTQGIRRIGMDPTGVKFGKYYNKGVELVTDFFSETKFRDICPAKKAKIVTSISMFYDLEDPISFSCDVESILADDGIWHMEQSYLPFVIRDNAYDMIGHEHLEYYSLGVLKFILESAGLRIIDVTANSINGGSLALTCAKKDSGYAANDVLINWMLKREAETGILTAQPYIELGKRAEEHRRVFTGLLDDLNRAGKLVTGYGASTKGNTILQYCGITPEHIKVFAEVNPDKFGCYTPGTHIPMEDEKKVRTMKPDYMVVMIWQFREMVIKKEHDFLASGGHLIFPLPNVEIV